MICSIDGCGGAVHGHGLCSRHYTKWRRHGNPLHAGRRYHKGLTTEERFWAYVSRRSGRGVCWEWTGMTSSAGYGFIHVRPGERALAHRYSYELHYGPIPDGKFILHHCDTPRCVNPRHLFCGTQQDNMDDMEAKGRAVKRGSRGEANSGNKITEAAVREIRASSEIARIIAEQHEVSVSLIHAIRQRRIWKHIK